MKYIIQVDGVYLGTENGLMLTWVNYKQQATEFSKEDMLTHIATIADSSLNNLKITIQLTDNTKV